MKPNRQRYNINNFSVPAWLVRAIRDEFGETSSLPSGIMTLMKERYKEAMDLDYEYDNYLCNLERDPTLDTTMLTKEEFAESMGIPYKELPTPRYSTVTIPTNF